MPHHIRFGRTGEDLAARWLSEKGFSVLQRNWRYGRYEVDIIAGRQGILHFIEVKSRRSTRYGYPEQSVSQKKLGNVMQGASGWLHRWPAFRRVQYDVLAITMSKDAPPEYMLFEDV
ncbi:MAG TPA: YraN family protein [Puia sp.]|jgi:putative endonuclease|nr:YraN family protein [Puia sp.]